MTNKSKENWKEIIETANNQDAHYSFELFEGLIEQAKLSQKQEDNERFEEFIKRLKEEVDMIQKDYATLEICDKDDVIKLINKLAEEFKGKQKQ